MEQGILTIAASTIPGEYVPLGLLAAFRAEVPQLEVRMTISDTTEVASRLLDDQADIGVISSAIRRPGLRLERLVGDQVVLAVPPDHPFVGQTEVQVGRLKGPLLILREEGSGTRRTVEGALVKADLNLPRDSVSLILGSTQASPQAVDKGLGVGFASARAVARAQADGHVACVGLAGVDLGRDLYLAYQPQHAGDPLVARFLRFARSRFAEGRAATTVHSVPSAFLRPGHDPAWPLRCLSWRCLVQDRGLYPGRRS